MKYSDYLIILFAVCSFALTGQEVAYDIRGTWGKPIPQEQLAHAETMIDINPGYPSSWIDQDDYISAEVRRVYDGQELIAQGKNDILNEAQKKLIHTADIGSDIRIEVKYHERDFLKKKLEVKTLSFALTVVPTVQAEYKGGQEALIEYLRVNTADLLPPSKEENLKVAMVKFTIDEHGRVTQPIISETSKDKDIDSIILKAIQQMPNWKPAQDAAGAYVPQSFEFIIGNSLGC